MVPWSVCNMYFYLPKTSSNLETAMAIGQGGGIRVASRLLPAPFRVVVSWEILPTRHTVII